MRVSHDQSHVIRIREDDGVAVSLAELHAGDTIHLGAAHIHLRQDIPKGHKIALRDFAPGDLVTKYGWPIGRCTAPIVAGDHVHSHNLESTLNEARTWSDLGLSQPQRTTDPLEGTWRGYVRTDGRAATRNEIWIVPTVGCVARTAEHLARAFEAELSEFPNVEGVVALPHPFGCSQLGDDLENTQRILAALARHPNAGATLVLGLGCENNNWHVFRPHLGEYDENTIRYLGAQQSTDEIGDGLALLRELAVVANRAERETLTVDKLVVGLKCGGSDGLSGITANPMLGRLSDRLCAAGGTAILTEVPEMFGAEQALLTRSRSERILQDGISMVRGFRQYFEAHGQPVDENPSPGNKAGGITTLEEKSLGCIQKGGDAVVEDVIAYGGQVRRPGLTLLDGPGNDQVSTTALAAAGATIVLFTTGRGTPLGCPAPTLKIATNSDLAEKKPRWIDFDAGRIVNDVPIAEVDSAFERLLIQTASGGYRTKSEVGGYRDLAIFKSGVTL